MNAENPSPPGDGSETGTPVAEGEREDKAEGAASSPAASKRPLVSQPARAAIFALGLGAVIAAFVVWLIPISTSTTTTKEHSTTTKRGGGGDGQTAVDKTTVTRTPGANRSDTVVLALLTLGGGLLLAASFWDRIQSLAIGGVSVSLADTIVASPRIYLTKTAAPHVQTGTSTAVDELVRQVDSVAKRDLRLVCVNLGVPHIWAPLNLSLFVLLLARRTNAEVIVFFEGPEKRDEAEPNEYVAAASVACFAEKLAARDPDLAAAHRATEMIPLDPSAMPAGGTTIGQTFFEKLGELDRRRADDAQVTKERVDLSRLEELAGRALITESVPSEGERTLSTRLQRDILAFPLPYVPITDRSRLEELVDRSRLAEQIALSVVGAASRT